MTIDARIAELTTKIAALCDAHSTSKWSVAGDPLVATVRPRRDLKDAHHLHIEGGRHRDYPIFEAADDEKHAPDVNVWHMSDVPEDLETALAQALAIMEAFATAKAGATAHATAPK